VSFFKLVAERGSWKSDIIGEAERLWLGPENNGHSFTNGLISPPSIGGGGDDRVREREGAKLRWWIAAEQGFEIAQNNLAYVLDQRRSSHICDMRVPVMNLYSNRQEPASQSHVPRPKQPNR
jgi:SEL1 protein